MSAVLAEFEDDATRGRVSQVATLRVPPHSIEAESSVLGGLLLNNDSWDRIGDLLTDSDFYRYEHRLIFGAIGQLINASRQADVVTVFVKLQEIGKGEEVGGLAYLNALAQYVPSAANARRYAEVIRERSILRKLVSASDEISTAAFNPGGKTVAAILDEAEQRILNIGEDENSTNDDWQGVESGVVDLLNHIQELSDGEGKVDFIPTGLADIDERLDGGMREGEVIVVGARPSMGKSALGLTIGRNVAEDGHPVAVFSMEMGKMQNNRRLMAQVARIPLGHLKRPERMSDFDWSNLTAGVEKIRKLPLQINDQTGLNINKVRSKARMVKRRHGLRLLVIDYLGLMDGTDPKQNRAYQIEEITKGLKGLAKELGITIIVLVQLKRAVDERADQMPNLADLRDSGAIEQDADVVMFVHRPWKAKPDLGDEWKDYAKVSIAKLRDGEPGYLDLMYVGKYLQFKDWPSELPKPSSQVRTAKAKPL